MEYQAPHVEVTSPFWTRFRNLVVDKVLPYQWSVINDEIDVEIPADPSGNELTGDTKSHAVRNLKVAAGEDPSEFAGVPFIDTDVFKWLEAVAYSLSYRKDPELQKLADEIIDIISKAQDSDGYLDTFIQLTAPQRRFKRLQQSHELYIMGHYIEAGVAYWEVTGNRTALEVAEKMAACIGENFGDEEGKIRGTDGHPEIEAALGRLAEATGKMEYAELSRWFLKTRGTDPEFFDRQNREDGWDNNILQGMRDFPKAYYQIDSPVVEQNDADGHAVRRVYLCTGFAIVARLTGDAELLAAAQRQWASIVHKRMYITGQIGSTHIGEAFTYDYDLPNTTMYGETCASVAMSVFSRRMLENEARGEYGDVLEKELFNGTISGMALDGQHFYYVNPMEEDPAASESNPDRKHVLTHRARWFMVACCPSNLARLITSLDRYIYVQSADGTILSHQFIASKAQFAQGFSVEQKGNFPWSGDISWTLSNDSGNSAQRFGIRIPAWSADSFTLKVNGDVVSAPEILDGFTYVEVAADSKMEIELSLDMSVRPVRANNRVAADAGKVAIMRGPMVFCAEQADNPEDLWRYRIATDDLGYSFEPDLLGGVGMVTAHAEVAKRDGDDAPLYAPAGTQQWYSTTMKLVPYYSWANRSVGQMRVWLER